jgi:hypothetical protein
MKPFLFLFGLLLALLVGYLWYEQQQSPRVIHMTVFVDTAPIIAPPPTNGTESVLSQPQISVAQINTILAAYHSPAAGKGQALYNLGHTYGINSDDALAFFFHESQFGTTGEARKTRSLGNERCIPDRPCVDQNQGGYAQMASWEDGFEHWYHLIKDGYVLGQVTIPIVGHPCTTIAQIVPVYAPSSDHNDVQAYIQAITNAVKVWRSGQVLV